MYRYTYLGGEADLIPPSVPSVPVAAKVALKLSVFWSDAVEVRFAQVDAQFAIGRTLNPRRSSIMQLLASLRMLMLRYWILSMLLPLSILMKS